MTAPLLVSPRQSIQPTLAPQADLLAGSMVVVAARRPARAKCSVMTTQTNSWKRRLEFMKKRGSEREVCPRGRAGKGGTRTGHTRGIVVARRDVVIEDAGALGA